MIPVAPLRHIFDWFFQPAADSADGRRDGMFHYMRISDPKYKQPNRITKFLDDVWDFLWHRNFGKYGRITFDFPRQTKYLLQRIFRASHTSDNETWDLYPVLAKKILPKLKAFRDYAVKFGHGTPNCFSDWNDDPKYGKYGWMGITKAEYMKGVKQGIYIGGGHKAWLKVLNEMIFAFDQILNYDLVEDKNSLAFLKRWHLKNPWAKTLKNRHTHYYYRSKAGNFMSSHKPVKENYTFLGKGYSYRNYELDKKINERAQRGLDLFAKHFLSLWD